MPQRLNAAPRGHHQRGGPHVMAPRPEVSTTPGRWRTRVVDRYHFEPGVPIPDVSVVRPTLVPVGGVLGNPMLALGSNLMYAPAGRVHDTPFVAALFRPTGTGVLDLVDSDVLFLADGGAGAKSGKPCGAGYTDFCIAGEFTYQNVPFVGREEAWRVTSFHVTPEGIAPRPVCTVFASVGASAATQFDLVGMTPTRLLLFTYRTYVTNLSDIDFIDVYAIDSTAGAVVSNSQLSFGDIRAPGVPVIDEMQVNSMGGERLDDGRCVLFVAASTEDQAWTTMLVLGHQGNVLSKRFFGPHTSEVGRPRAGAPGGLLWTTRGLYINRWTIEGDTSHLYGPYEYRTDGQFLNVGPFPLAISGLTFNFPVPLGPSLVQFGGEATHAGRKCLVTETYSTAAATNQLVDRFEFCQSTDAPPDYTPSTPYAIGGVIAARDLLFGWQGVVFSEAGVFRDMQFFTGESYFEPGTGTAERGTALAIEGRKRAQRIGEKVN